MSESPITEWGQLLWGAGRWAETGTSTGTIPPATGFVYHLDFSGGFASGEMSGGM